MDYTPVPVTVTVVSNKNYVMIYVTRMNKCTKIMQKIRGKSGPSQKNIFRMV